MNAEAITKSIMQEILHGHDSLSGDQFVTINWVESERIRYAISRAVGSIISGLGSTDEESDRYECDECQGRCKGHATTEPPRCGEPVPGLHNESCTLPLGHDGEHELWRPSFESASEAHAAGVRPDMGTLAVRLCHEKTGLQGDPDTAEVVAKWLIRNYEIREPLPTASAAHAHGIPVLGAAGAFGGFCLKTPVSNVDSSLMVACGLTNGHDGQCDFTRQIAPPPV